MPYTRVASWGRDFKNLLAYLQKNREEASGQRPYEPRKKRRAKCKPANPDGGIRRNVRKPAARERAVSQPTTLPAAPKA